MRKSASRSRPRPSPAWPRELDALASAYADDSRLFWRRAVKELGWGYPDRVRLACRHFLCAMADRGVTPAMSVFRLASEPRWTDSAAERDAQLLAALIDEAHGRGVGPHDPIEIDGEAQPLLERLRAHAQLGLGFGEAAASALRAFAWA